MSVVETRRAYRAAWMAWHQARHIRASVARMGHNRNTGQVKQWYDECWVMLRRAERIHRRALR